jgi:V8-like Glu-specific endopeptidase
MKAAVPAEAAAPADTARSARSALSSRSAAGTAAGAAVRGAWLDGDSEGDGLRWAHGGAVERTTGKVFFTLDGTDYVCSGTAIRSPQADIVLTAAHCVADSEQDWATNWTFVPGYQDGSQPYGAFTAQRFFVSPQWAGSGSDTPRAEQYDVAFVTVNPASSSSASARLPAGQPIAFGDALGTATPTYVFGYPSEPPFTGLYPNYCAGSTLSAQMDGTTSLRCVMTAGDSGGPWLTGFDPRTGTGTVVAVTTFKYDGDSSVLYGTALGPAARELYEEASSSLTPDPSLARP